MVGRYDVVNPFGQEVGFTEGVVTDVWEIIQMRTNLVEKDCFFFRLDFETFRENLDRKENSRCQKPASLDFVFIMTRDHFVREIF